MENTLLLIYTVGILAFTLIPPSHPSYSSQSKDKEDRVVRLVAIVSSYADSVSKYFTILFLTNVLFYRTTRQESK